MSITVDTAIKPNVNIADKTDTITTKEKKSISPTAAIALTTSLSALASFGTYLVMRGRSKAALKFKQSKIDELEKNLRKKEELLKKVKESLEKDNANLAEQIKQTKAMSEELETVIIELKRKFNF